MRAGLAFLAALALLAVAPAARAQAFGDWAAVVVAGDWKGTKGGATEAFDNARRDVAAALETAGFDRANLRQFSVRPERYRDTRPAKSEPRVVYEALKDLTSRTSGGCLVYFTSHGAPQGVLVGETVMPPPILDRMLDETCGARPTVVVVSACFSGVFVPALAGPNRMVLTAARPDRSSFGCGEADAYPYFDACLLDEIGGSTDFPALARRTAACVRTREIAEKVSPPSEPQLFVSPEMRAMLPLMAFRRADSRSD